MKITIKKYVEDTTISFEERYQRLLAHHTEETQYSMAKISELEAEVRALEVDATRMREYRFALEGISTDGKGNPLASAK